MNGGGLQLVRVSDGRVMSYDPITAQDRVKFRVVRAGTQIEVAPQPTEHDLAADARKVVADQARRDMLEKLAAEVYGYTFGGDETVEQMETVIRGLAKMPAEPVKVAAVPPAKVEAVSPPPAAAVEPPVDVQAVATVPAPEPPFGSPQEDAEGVDTLLKAIGDDKDQLLVVAEKQFGLKLRKQMACETMREEIRKAAVAQQ